MTIHLVACCSVKLDRAAPARELYASDLFRKTRKVVEATGQPWWILSAGLHLVHPQLTIPPYDVSLHSFDDDERADWARHINRQIARRVKSPATVKLWAGKLYREPLADLLTRRGHRVEVPLFGLGIGQQKKRLLEMAQAVAV